MPSWEKYNSKETGEYIKFCLWLNGKNVCKKHGKHWGFGTQYPSDNEKYFGFKKQGMEAFL